jgi:hypothetical protein
VRHYGQLAALESDFSAEGAYRVATPVPIVVQYCFGTGKSAIVDRCQAQSIVEPLATLAAHAGLS